MTNEYSFSNSDLPYQPGMAAERAPERGQLFSVFEQQRQRVAEVLNKQPDLYIDSNPKQFKEKGSKVGPFGKLKRWVALAFGGTVLVAGGLYARENFARPGVAKLLNAFRSAESQWKEMLEKHTNQEIAELSAGVCKRAKAIKDDTMTKGSDVADAIAAQLGVICRLPLLRHIPQLGHTFITGFAKQRPGHTGNMAHELLHAFQNQFGHINTQGKIASIWSGKVDETLLLMMDRVRDKIGESGGSVTRQGLADLMASHGINDLLAAQRTSTLKNLKMQYVSEIQTHRAIVKNAERLEVPLDEVAHDRFCVEIYRQFNQAIRRELRRRKA